MGCGVVTAYNHGGPSVGEIKPDTDASISFLKAFAPEALWVLTAIAPDGGKTYTDTFGPENEEACRTWIDSHQGIKNIYFMVNPPLGKLQSKASKTDVKEMAWLHVDVDPRAGEDIETERARAWKMLSEFEPKPSLIIDSGGGFQGFWRLERPVPVDKDEHRCEELEKPTTSSLNCCSTGTTATTWTVLCGCQELSTYQVRRSGRRDGS